MAGTGRCPHSSHVFVAHDNPDHRAQDPHFIENIPGVRGRLTANQWDPSLTSATLTFLRLVRAASLRGLVDATRP